MQGRSPRRSGRCRCRTRRFPRGWPSRRASSYFPARSSRALRPDPLPRTGRHRSAGAPARRRTGRPLRAAGSRCSRAVAAVAVALPEQPGCPSRIDEHARVDRPSLRHRADKSRRRVVDEGARRARARRPRDAKRRPRAGRECVTHAAGVPAPGSRGDGRRRRVVHDIGAIRASPHRGRPLEAGHGPSGEDGKSVAQVMALEPRITGQCDDRDVGPGAYWVFTVLVA